MEVLSTQSMRHFLPPTHFLNKYVIGEKPVEAPVFASSDSSPARRSPPLPPPLPPRPALPPAPLSDDSAATSEDGVPLFLGRAVNAGN